MRYETEGGCDKTNTNYELINITHFFKYSVYYTGIEVVDGGDVCVLCVCWIAQWRK
jgi:hypothetical protein